MRIDTLDESAIGFFTQWMRWNRAYLEKVSGLENGSRSFERRAVMLRNNLVGYG